MCCTTKKLWNVQQNDYVLCNKVKGILKCVHVSKQLYIVHQKNYILCKKELCAVQQKVYILCSRRIKYLAIKEVCPVYEQNYGLSDKQNLYT